MTDQEWNEGIQQHNRKALADAQRLHELKQAIMQKVIEANRILVNAYRDEGLPREMPEDLSSISMRLGRIVRELDAKIEVELLGQAEEEFRMEVPAWVQAK